MARSQLNEKHCNKKILLADTRQLQLSLKIWQVSEKGMDTFPFQPLWQRFPEHLKNTQFGKWVFRQLQCQSLYAARTWPTLAQRRWTISFEKLKLPVTRGRLTSPQSHMVQLENLWYGKQYGREKPLEVDLADGDIITMEDLMQDNYQHSIAPGRGIRRSSRARVDANFRSNLTFRKIKRDHKDCPSNIRNGRASNAQGDHVCVFDQPMAVYTNPEHCLEKDNKTTKHVSLLSFLKFMLTQIAIAIKLKRMTQPNLL